MPKRRILEAVREGAGEHAAQLIDHLKKGDMAKEAERLLAGSFWLPEPLRLTEMEMSSALDEPETEASAEELLAFLSDNEDAPDEYAESLPAIAAE